MPAHQRDPDKRVTVGQVLRAIMPPLILIFAVLGSILAGLATPTEAAGVGAMGALALAAKEQKDLLTLHSQGLSATFGRQRRPWRELLTFLAGAEALPCDAPAPPAVSPSVLRLPCNPGGAA